MVAEVYQALTAGRSAIDSLKMLSQYANEVKDVQKRGEFMRIIGESSVELAETQIRLAEQMRVNDELKEEIKALKNELENIQNPEMQFVWKGGLYYREDGDGPFCTACYDSDRKSIRVSEAPSMVRSIGSHRYRCNVCKAVYS